MTNSTQAALAAALANEASALAASEQAARAVHAAQAARDALIAQAAAGKPVTAEAVRAAEEKTREAEIASEIAGRVLAAAVALRERAQVARWHAEAAELQTAIEAAIEARLAAGAAVDGAMNEVRALLAVHAAAGAELHDAVAAAQAFNGERDARRATNAALRHQIDKEGPADPLIRNVPRVQPGALEVFLYPRGGWREFTSPLASARIL